MKKTKLARNRDAVEHHVPRAHAVRRAGSMLNGRFRASRPSRMGRSRPSRQSLRSFACIAQGLHHPFGLLALPAVSPARARRYSRSILANSTVRLEDTLTAGIR